MPPCSLNCIYVENCKYYSRIQGCTPSPPPKKNNKQNKTKKSINSGIVAISTCCGIWEVANDLINQSKTLYDGEVLQPCCWRRSSSVLVLHSHAIPLPTVNHNSSLGHGFVCSRPLELPGGKFHLVLINLPCHLITGFGGNKDALWLCRT